MYSSDHHRTGRPEGPATTSTRRSRRSRLALLAAPLLLIAACGSDDSSGSPDDAPPASDAQTDDASAPDDTASAGDTSTGDTSDTGDTSTGDTSTGDTSAPAPDESEPTTGGSITVGLESETNTWLPSAFAGSQAGYNVAWSVYDPLIRRNGEGMAVPYLAETMEPNDDFTEWTLTLRDGVMFHDGTPLDAAALASNFEVLKAPGARTAGALRDVESMEVVDDLTVRYVLSLPNAALPDALQGPSGWPFSPTAYEALGDAFGDQPVGTGPFKFVSWQRDGSFVAERNDDYWQDGLPYLDEITFRPIPDEETRATSVASGDIDATQSVRLSSFLAKVRDVDNMNVSLGLGNAGGGMYINTQRPPVDDVRVRKALALALDQQALIDVVAGDAADATELRTQYYATNSPYYSQAAADAWPTQDVDAAKALYEEYVNDPARSDGEAPGTPIKLDYGCTNVPSLQLQAQAYQGMWQEVGFEVELKPLEQSILIQTALEGDYTLSCFRTGSQDDPLTTIQNAYGPVDVSPLNFSNFNTSEIDDIIMTLRTTDDVPTRAAAVEEFSLLLADQLPWIWTGSDLAFIAANDKIGGVDTWTLPDGTAGTGAESGITMWGLVWTGE